MAAPTRGRQRCDQLFTRYIGTIANWSPDDRGLGSDKTFRTLMRCVATVYRELSTTKRKKIILRDLTVDRARLSRTLQADFDGPTV